MVAVLMMTLIYGMDVHRTSGWWCVSLKLLLLANAIVLWAWRRGGGRGAPEVSCTWTGKSHYAPSCA